MLNNKKYRMDVGAWAILIAIGLAALFGGGGGCTPSGPRALLEGRRLLEQGHSKEALPRLLKATELLPTNAIAWESLGVACHHEGQWDAALKAYQTALKLDDRMSVLRFNLGCLYLDLNNPAAAIDELRTFTVLQPTAVDGWIKLGTAQYRVRRLDDAEKSFRSALGLQAHHPEALNGQGLIMVQRRRWPEAITLFNAASTADTNFAPAHLNAAVVQHQYLNNRGAALHHYRQYATLHPFGADDVRPVIAQLERELAPPTVAAPTTVVPAKAPLPSTSTSTPSSRSNPPAATSSGYVFTERPMPERAVPEREPRGRATNSNAQASASSPATSSTPTGAGRTSPRTETGSATRPSVPTRSAPATITNLAAAAPSTGASPTTATSPPAKPVESPLEIAQVRDDVVVRPAQDLSASTSGGPVTSNHVALTSSPAASTRTAEATPPPKKGFLSRINPFTRSGRETNDAGAMNVAARTSEARDLQRPEGLPELAPPSISRYTYASPSRPAEGNHSAAEQAFKRGVRWQKSGDRAKAAAEYQAAIRADPGGFDAYYNLGLVALDSGDARLSLWAYEYALAIQPDSTDARYNLSLALKAGGYPLDAADQLQILVQRDPNDARAQLSLGNLYAQQLKQPRRARENYLRVLELNPRHPDAPAIRYWLAANP